MRRVTLPGNASTDRLVTVESSVEFSSRYPCECQDSSSLTGPRCHSNLSDSNKDESAETKDSCDSQRKEIEQETGERARQSDLQMEASDERVAELEGEPSLPLSRILIHPKDAVKNNNSLVFGSISIMVQNVEEDALLLPLRSPALADMLEHGHKYKALALRCKCELVFTRRIIVKKVLKWCRFSLLLLRGPSVAAIRRFRLCLENVNPAFNQARLFDAERPRPRLLASETLPDNLSLSVCSERMGPASAAWERRLPLTMPQQTVDELPCGKHTSKLFPNNGTIAPVLAYIYPKWGFQKSKPISHTKLFNAAVQDDMEMDEAPHL